MKTNYKATVMAMALALGFGMAALAYSDTSGNTPGSNTGSPNSPSMVPSATPSSTAKVITGTVQNVDPTTNTVQVKDTSGHLQTLKVDNSTQISREGTPVQIAQLRMGDVVIVRNSASTM